MSRNPSMEFDYQWSKTFFLILQEKEQIIRQTLEIFLGFWKNKLKKKKKEAFFNSINMLNIKQTTVKGLKLMIILNEPVSKKYMTVEICKIYRNTTKVNKQLFSNKSIYSIFY